MYKKLKEMTMSKKIPYNPDHLHFIGDFKKLKSLGYKHHKLYASNYRAYIKQNTSEATILVLIWMGGREVRIGDMTIKQSKMFVDAIKAGTLGDIFDPESTTLVINRESDEFEKYDAKIHSSVSVLMGLAAEKGLQDCRRIIREYEAEYVERLEKFNCKYKKIDLFANTVRAVQELLDQKMV